MRIIAIAAALLMTPLAAACQQTAGEAEQTAELLTVSIRTASGGRHDFKVEVARTAAEQERGLMYRTGLPADGGMLFPFPTPEPRSFWMKNMVIPLDMLFIRQDGSIARLAEQTIPQSLDPVVCTEPVVAVLEIAGGRATALGIAEGDYVEWVGGPTPK
jgi:uncharacterized protein